MKLVVTDIIKRIDSINKYIDIIKLNNDLIRTDSQEYEKYNQIKDYIDISIRCRDKRIYEYNLLIITLYGILENFIEEIIKAYLKQLCKIVPEYKQLPVNVKKNHVPFSANLLNYIRTMSKYEHIKEEEVIFRLNSCLNHFKIYELNIEAFTHHSKNFRQDSITEIFSNIGIDNVLGKVILNDEFLNYYAKLYVTTTEDVKQRPKSWFFNRLDDLARRRNEISHGTITDEILSVDRIKDEVDFIALFIKSLYEILNEQLMYYEFKHTKKFQIKEITDIFNNEIICFEIDFKSIRVGDKIFAYNKNTQKINGGHINSIKIGQNKVDETPLEEKVKVGVKVDFKAKSNYDYYIQI